jgi:hypothetical protein
MDIFISWSGPRSEAVARALHGWLPKIINAFKPWLSSADIDKGARWSTDVAVRLQAAKAGIICVTPSNLRADWILFEAGALSKTLQNTFVCPLLIGLQPADVKGPLAQFQATRTTKEDVLRLLKTLNTGLGDAALADAHIEEAFEVWWPKLDAEFNKLPVDDSSARPHRSDRDVLEEILGLVRSQSRPKPTTEGEAPDRVDPMDLVVTAMLGADPSLDGISTPDNIEFTLTSKGVEKYKIRLPHGTPLDEIGPRVRSQIRRQRIVRLPAPPIDKLQGKA